MRAFPGIAILALVAAAASAAGAPRLRIEQTAGTGELAALVLLARGVEVIGLGESHDNPAHHAAQGQVLDALVVAGQRPVLAFEMLSHEQQAVVDRAMTEALTPDDLERRLAWRARGWPDFAMYFPLFAMARRHALRN